MKRGGNRPGRRSGFGNGMINLIPDECIVRVVSEDCNQKRFDPVEVEAIRVGRGIEA